MTRPRRVWGRLATAASSISALLFLSILPAFAAGSPELVVGPRPWAVALQAGYSPVKRDMIALNHIVLGIILFICLVVGALLVWVMVRYNAKRNPVPSTATHNTLIEVTWTIVPILILVGMAIPSFKLVYYEDRTDAPDMTIKVTGHQWYWEYAYPGLKGVDFNSYFVPQKELKPGQPRLLTASAPLVLPVGKNIRVLQTSGDVIHSFFVPSLGMQRYAIPGRTIETWVRIDKPGLYYGECNQICGTNHSRMPIDVLAVTPAQFKVWAEKEEKQAATADATPLPPHGATASVELASATRIDATARR